MRREQSTTVIRTSMMIDIITSYNCYSHRSSSSMKILPTRSAAKIPITCNKWQFHKSMITICCTNYDNHRSIDGQAQFNYNLPQAGIANPSAPLLPANSPGDNSPQSLVFAADTGHLQWLYYPNRWPCSHIRSPGTTSSCRSLNSISRFPGTKEQQTHTGLISAPDNVS